MLRQGCSNQSRGDDFLMARYLGPKVKLSRRVGVPIEDIPKHTARRQLNAPGMHGYRNRRPKDYGIRLTEKQKLRYHYSILEKQFRRYIVEASRRKGNTGDVLLQLLESRLDNVLRRSGFVRTIWAARQTVVHGPRTGQWQEGRQAEYSSQGRRCHHLQGRYSKSDSREYGITCWPSRP